MSATPSSPPRIASGRLRSLDGLRGVAAGVVLVHHTSLIVLPALAILGASMPERLLSRTPLALLVAGHESVIVFFVLSGFVVTLPFLKPKTDLLAYYPSRLIRLYFPVWGALVLAGALVVFVPRDPASILADSWLVSANALAIDPGDLASQFTLTAGQYSLNNPLWSLRWEVLYSLLAPLFVLMARWCSRFAIPAAIAAAVVVMIGDLNNNSYLIYLPPFFIGALLAVRLPDIMRMREARPRPALWTLVVLASLVLLLTSSLSSSVVEDGSLLASILYALLPLGAGLLVLASVGWIAAARVLETRLPQWLGKISFSLYLVHVPVLATVAFAVGDAQWGLVIGIGVPASLLIGWLFYRVVERPSHKLSQIVRDRIRARKAS